MGFSAASLHILLPPRTDAAASLRRAYAALGFAPPRNEADAIRHAILAPSGRFLSVHDSVCALRDDGSLRAMAAHVSASLRTAVVITAVQDSEDFEFILYHRGRQVDSAVSDPDTNPDALNAVRGLLQADLWRTALGVPTQPSGTDNQAAPFLSAVTSTPAATGAEARLAAWCALAELPPAAPLRAYDELAAKPGLQRIALAASKPRRPARGQPSQRTLHYERNDREYPYHRCFPAAWPIEAGTHGSYTWPVLCRAGGLKRLRLALHLDRSGGFVLRRVSIAAYVHLNGSIMSATPLASFGQAVPRDAGLTEADIAFDADPFTLYQPDTTAGLEYMLLIRIELRAPRAGEVLMTPTLRADARDAAPLILPTLRLAATKRTWIPIVADPHDENPARRQAVVRLNAPAIHSAAAILPATREDPRPAMRRLVERWLQPMTDAALTATIVTQKHSSLTGVPAQPGIRRVPLATLLQGPFWPKLFATSRDWQTVRLEIGVGGAAHALAGFSLQASLRGPPVRTGGATLALVLWAINDPSALALLRISAETTGAAFAAWVRTAAPLQAWISTAAWIPEFDQDDAYALTLYEASAALEWQQRGLAGTLTDGAWLRRRLRFVAPRLWLGWELAAIINVARFTAIAHVMEIDDGVEIELRDPADLPVLERLLVPVLPLRP
jgi:hypothetical protein